MGCTGCSNNVNLVVQILDIYFMNEFKVHINNNIRSFEADLSRPFDLSLPLQNGTSNPTAWYCGPVVIRAVENEFFVGDVTRGGSVNFRDVFFNPHGHGTHTECVGHISREFYSVNESLKTFFFLARVISIEPELTPEGDRRISLEQVIAKAGDMAGVKALIIRTLPNDIEKRTRNYSNTNPPYFEHAVGEWLRTQGIKHWLTDLPSVDREEDDGVLAAHHAFWNYPQNPVTDATITELIFVPDHVPDGIYLLNLQMASFHNDASPSKPVLYPVTVVS